MKRALFVILSILIMASCHRHPDYVIGEKEMEDLLVDIHKAEAVIESNYNIYNNNATKKKLREAVFLRHGVTQEQFDTTLVWYGHHIDKYMEIYDRVAERLRAENEEAKKLLAEENSQTMTQPGDSVDVRKQKRFHLFDSRLPSNLLTFDIATDENFRIRDYFELRFKVLMLPELNVKPQVYMAVRHANNDLAYNWVDVEKEGWCTLSVQATRGNIVGHIAKVNRIVDNGFAYREQQISGELLTHGAAKSEKEQCLSAAALGKGGSTPPLCPAPSPPHDLNIRKKKPAWLQPHRFLSFIPSLSRLGRAVVQRLNSSPP